MRLTPVILAAGQGRRMGMPKALAVLPGQADGHTFLRRILNTCAASAVLEAPVVVIGAQAQDVRQVHADLSSVRWVENPAWATADMLSSLRLGVGVLGAGEDVLVWPVDCPRVSVGVVDALGEALAAARGARKMACVPVYEGRRGHPVVLSAALCRILLDDMRIEHLRALLGSVEVELVFTKSFEILDNLNSIPQ